MSDDKYPLPVFETEQGELIKELQKRLAEAEAVLRYYAQDWDVGCGCCVRSFKETTNPYIDQGCRACAYFDSRVEEAGE